MSATDGLMTTTSFYFDPTTENDSVAFVSDEHFEDKSGHLSINILSYDINETKLHTDSDVTSDNHFTESLRNISSTSFKGNTSVASTTENTIVFQTTSSIFDGSTTNKLKPLPGAMLQPKSNNAHRHSSPDRGKSKYKVLDENGRVIVVNRQSKPMTIKHHLQLVPMDDEPLGTFLKENDRYIISIVVPVAVGMVGAVLIVGTVLTLRYVARQRPRVLPLDNESSISDPPRTYVSSISAETTDSTFLLHGSE